MMKRRRSKPLADSYRADIAEQIVGTSCIVDHRIDLEDPKPASRGGDDGHNGDLEGACSAWSIYAQPKYWSRKTHGPRMPGKRPDDLRKAAIMLRDAMAAAWRAGYRVEDLAAEMFRVIREEPPPERAWERKAQEHLGEP